MPPNLFAGRYRAIPEGPKGLTGPKGSTGNSGSDGYNGWTPILTPELDGTRTLLKVGGWSNGSGTMPPIGMYLATGGYTMVKADAFNFNQTKRVESYNATTVTNGEVTITFNTAFAQAPRVLATARAGVSGQPMMAEVVSVSTTNCVIRVSQARATVGSLLNTLFNVVVGAQVDVIVVER